MKLLVAAKVDLEMVPSAELAIRSDRARCRGESCSRLRGRADEVGETAETRLGTPPSGCPDRTNGGREVRCRVEIPTLQEGGNSPKVTFWALLGERKGSTMVEHGGEPGRPGGPPPAARGRPRGRAPRLFAAVISRPQGGQMGEGVPLFCATSGVPTPPAAPDAGRSCVDGVI